MAYAQTRQPGKARESIARTFTLPPESAAAHLLTGQMMNRLELEDLAEAELKQALAKDAGADRDTGPNRPNLIGNASGPHTQSQWFNALPIGATGSAFSRPAVGTFGNLPRNALRGPRYWRTDASLFKKFLVGTGQEIELRAEAVNIFNHVNLGNPDSEIGVPGNNNANAGRITSTAYFGADPQRNFQFAIKFVF